jgi:hypothetical protein
MQNNPGVDEWLTKLPSDLQLIAIARCKGRDTSTLAFSSAQFYLIRKSCWSVRGRDARSKSGTQTKQRIPPREMDCPNLETSANSVAKGYTGMKKRKA